VGVIEQRFWLFVNFGMKRLMADFGEKVRQEKQAGIGKPLMKSAALHYPLAFLSRFTIRVFRGPWGNGRR
jgi:hypothetical protein